LTGTRLGRLRRFASGWLPRVLLVHLVLVAVLNAVRPVVSYRAVALGAGPTEIGLIAASFGIVSLVIAMPAGRWVDRYGEMLFIGAGVSLVTVVALTMGFTDSLLVLAISMTALGAGQIIAAAAIQTLVANAGAAEDRDSRFGAHTVVASFGQLIGPAAAGVIIASGLQGASSTAHVPLHATDNVFLSAAGAGVVALLLAVSLWRRPPKDSAFVDRVRADPERVLSTRRAIGRVFRVPSMPQAMLASLTVLSTVDILVAYLPVYAVANGVPVETVGLLLAARGAASMVSRAFMVPLLHRVSRRRLLVGSMVVPAAAVAIFPSFGANVGLLLGAMLLIGFGLGLGQPLTMSWVASRAPVEIRGTALGARLSANRFGQFAVPASVGFIAGTAGLFAIFWSLGALLVVSALLVAQAPFDAPRAVDDAATGATGQLPQPGGVRAPAD